MPIGTGWLDNGDDGGDSEECGESELLDLVKHRLHLPLLNFGGVWWHPKFPQFTQQFECTQETGSLQTDGVAVSSANGGI